MKTTYFVRTAVSTVAFVLASTASAATLPSELFANMTAFTQVNVWAAWARGYTGKGVKIGFVDTGADLTNPDLRNVVLSKSPYYTTMTDVNRGHGTAMISLAAGAGNGTGVVGIAYGATSMMYAGGLGGLLLVSDVVNGIKWNADNKADVINLRLGNRMDAVTFNALYTASATGSYSRKTTVVDAYASTAMLPALQYATSKGSIIVMAAGNDGLPVPTSPANLAVKVDATGNLVLGGRALIVGAVDSNNVIASFSNRAGNICQNLVSGVCKDAVQIKDYFLVAPGGSLVWTANANNSKIIVQDVGTSDSAAFVSGGIAVIKQAWPTLKPEQIVQLLLQTATPLGTGGVNEVYGHGLMNLGAATAPMGVLALAKMTTASSTQIIAGTTVLSTSGITGGILTKQSFSNGTVMQNAQAVDTIGRNFTVDMTNGMTATPQNYNPATAYSSLSKNNLIYVDLGNEGVVNNIFASDNMKGAKLGHKFENNYAGIEFGKATERNSVLGSHGTGALALGNSSTSWTALHLAHNVTAASSVFGSVATGSTVASAADNSMINGFSKIATRSWTAGVKTGNVFTESDAISVQVTNMPYITKGSANVSGVTGYTVTNATDNGATVTPVIGAEKTSLASKYRQYATTVTYARLIGNDARVQLSGIVQSDNVASALNPSLQLSYVQRF